MWVGIRKRKGRNMGVRGGARGCIWGCGDVRPSGWGRTQVGCTQLGRTQAGSSKSTMPPPKPKEVEGQSEGVVEALSLLESCSFAGVRKRSKLRVASPKSLWERKRGAFKQR